MGFFSRTQPHPITTGQAKALWIAHAPPTNYPALRGELTVDVAIVGAGIVGLTVARLLQDAGRRVALIEGGRIGQSATGLSTAKVTAQHGLCYDRMIRRHGRDTARLYADANSAAIEQVAHFVSAHNLVCSFDRARAYLYALEDSGARQLEREAEAAQSLGLPALYDHHLSLPFAVRGAVSFENQAQFDPSKYLIGLAASLTDDGCQVFEQSRVTKLEHGTPCRVETSGGAVIAQDVVIATHLPIIGAGKFFLKAQPYAHPMVAAPIDEARAPVGMYLGIDSSPSHSFRTVRSEGTCYLVAVGGAYRPGDADAATRMFEDLEQFVRTQLGVASIAYRWTNEDYNSADGIPFVGSADEDNPHFKIATAFAAWGITNGTAAGMILANQLLGRANPWASAFDSLRKPDPTDRPAALKEKSSMVATLLSGVLPRHHDVAQLEAGGGMIADVDGRKLALHRDESGTLHAVSAKCTHMGCTVGWNPVDCTWDCGCHGSRFTADGEVLHGPAQTSLEKEKTPTT